MKLDKPKPELVGKIPPAMSMTMGQLYDGWGKKAYSKLSEHWCVVSNGGNNYLNQRMSDLVAAGQPTIGIFTVGEAKEREFISRNFWIHIFGNTVTVRMDGLIPDTARRVLMVEPLNPTARVLAATSIPGGTPIPDELVTWDAIRDWLNSGTEYEFAPIPEEVLDAEMDGLSVWSNLSETCTVEMKGTQTRGRPREIGFTYKDLKTLVEGAVAEGKTWDDVLELAREHTRKAHEALDPDLSGRSAEHEIQESKETGPWVRTHETDVNGLWEWVENSLSPEVVEKLRPNNDDEERYDEEQPPEEQEEQVADERD